MDNQVTKSDVEIDDFEMQKALGRQRFQDKKSKETRRFDIDSIEQARQKKKKNEQYSRARNRDIIRNAMNGIYEDEDDGGDEE